MAKISLVKLASTIALKEGLKKQVSVGNVREIMKLLFKEMKHWNLDQFTDVVKRY